MKRTLLMVFVVVIVSQLTYSENKICNETEEQKLNAWRDGPMPGSECLFTWFVCTGSPSRRGEKK